jgi:hypothetical protein
MIMITDLREGGKGISLRTFRRRYPQRKKDANGKWVPTEHKLFSDAFCDPKATPESRQAALEAYLFK